MWAQAAKIPGMKTQAMPRAGSPGSIARTAVGAGIKDATAMERRRIAILEAEMIWKRLLGILSGDVTVAAIMRLA